MSILASGLDSAQQITVVVLCVALIVFLLVNALLVLSLHKQNKKLVKRKENNSEPAEDNKAPDKNDEEITPAP